MADINIECRLTTNDNPYDPFDQFDQWYLYDTVEKGYNTCSKVARLAELYDDMSDKEYNDEIERVYDEIIQYDFLNMYKKVFKVVN